MGKYKQTNNKEFISIEKALDMIEPFDEYAHYDEDQEEKEDMPTTFNGSEENKLISLIFNASPVQGSVAAPSKSTKNKFYSQARERSSRKEDGLHVSGEFFPLTIGWEDTLQYDSDLKPITDYHKAMMDNIKNMYEGDPVWTFKNQTKTQRKLDMYSFVYVQQIREFYNLDKKNTCYIEDLEEIIEEYGKTLPTPLALRILALEQSDKEWFKGYMPSTMYKAIKKQLCKSLDLADKDYIAKGGKDPEIRKKALESTIKEIRL